MIIPLSKPFKYEDHDLTEINLDLYGAPPSVLTRADKEVARRKHTPIVKQVDTLYCGIIASYVTGIPYAVLENLPLRDYNLLTTAVSGFLLNSEEASMETDETETPQSPSEE